jgi:hypothetical protein
MPVLIKDHVGCALLQQALSCVLTHTWFVGLCKLSSLTVIELNDTLPRFTGVHWDSVRATHKLPVEVFTWKMALGRGRTRLFDSQCEWWPPVIPMWFMCVMLSGYFPCKVTIDSNLRNTLRYVWGLFAMYKRRSDISPWSYKVYGYV